MELLAPFVGVPEVNKVYHSDCFTLMAALPDKSVDAYILDLPYGTTACSWDEIIPFAPMWAEVKRTLKPRGVFVTTASQPFTSKLVMSNVGMFKYSWVWIKTKASDHINAKNKPMKKHEDVLVFSNGTTANGSENKMTYNPQDLKYLGEYTYRPNRDTGLSHILGVRPSHKKGWVQEFTNYPNSVLEFPNPNNDIDHPTQKPVALYEYLIRTYTQPDELVVDFCCGSGTTAIAARNTGRRFICGDITHEYVEVARRRLAQPFTPMFAELTA